MLILILNLPFVFTSRNSDITNAGTETNINLKPKLHYHVLGTDQSEDILCWKDPDRPTYRVDPRVTHDGKVIFSLNL